MRVVHGLLKRAIIFFICPTKTLLFLLLEHEVLVNCSNFDNPPKTKTGQGLGTALSLYTSLFD